MIRHECKLFLVALQLLTRIPIKAFDGFDPTWIDRSAKYFPLVGAFVGLVAAATLFLTAGFFPDPLPAILAMTVAVLLTGAFHEDGLADTADGLGGGATRERRLEIMKDSRIGNYGAIALILVLALKGGALIALDPMSAARALIFAHAGARLAMVVAMFTMSYAGVREASKVQPLSTPLTYPELGLAVLFGIVPGLLVLSPATLIIGGLAAALAVIVLAVIAQRRLGGYTGDVLGAFEQVFEMTFLLVAAAIISGPG